MAEPTRPATRMETMTGPSSRDTVRPTSEPMNCLAPKLSIEKPAWRASTPPMKKLRIVTIGMVV